MHDQRREINITNPSYLPTDLLFYDLCLENKRRTVCRWKCLRAEKSLQRNRVCKPGGQRLTKINFNKALGTATLRDGSEKWTICACMPKEASS
eukprot:1156223-Pelagomonas_calceolata.AAC.2